MKPNTKQWLFRRRWVPNSFVLWFESAFYKSIPSWAALKFWMVKRCICLVYFFQLPARPNDEFRLSTLYNIATAPLLGDLIRSGVCDFKIPIKQLKANGVAKEAARTVTKLLVCIIGEELRYSCCPKLCLLSKPQKAKPMNYPTNLKPC